MKGNAIGNLLSVTDARLGTVNCAGFETAPKNHKFDGENLRGLKLIFTIFASYTRRKRRKTYAVKYFRSL